MIGNDIIPSVVKNYRINAFPFRDENGDRAYWRDVGTLDSFWLANMELVSTAPPLNIYNESWPLWTYQEQLPPAKFVFDEQDRRGMALESMVSGGCIVSGAVLRKSVLFSKVKVKEHSEIVESIILPEVVIEPGCTINKAIIDRGCVIPAGTKIGVDHEQDKANGFRVTSKGVVLVTRGMLGQQEGYM